MNESLGLVRNDAKNGRENEQNILWRSVNVSANNRIQNIKQILGY
jgi:hypothetical protein